MIGLFNVQRAMQDPFDVDGLDNVCPKTMCQEICNAIKVLKYDGNGALNMGADDFEQDEFHSRDSTSQSKSVP